MEDPRLDQGHQFRYCTPRTVRVSNDSVKARMRVPQMGTCAISDPML